MERNEEKCLIDHLGNCMGCEVLNTANEALLRGNHTLVQKVKETLCPDEGKMVIPPKDKRSIW